MSQIKAHCNLSDAEDECRRRLAACCALLLDLAEKRRCETSGDVSGLNSVDPISTTEAESKECFDASSLQEPR